MPTERKTEKVGTYLAVDDLGRRHTIHVHALFVRSTFLSDPPSAWQKATESHKMANGNHVNVHDDGTLEEVRTGLKMRRVTK